MYLLVKLDLGVEMLSRDLLDVFVSLPMICVEFGHRRVQDSFAACRSVLVLTVA